MNTPPWKVMQAFGLGGEGEKLEGGQGNVFAFKDIVLKPVVDEAEAVWIAETHLGMEQRGFRLARSLVFRLAIDGLFALDDPGPFWSARIARDIAGARPLLEYLER